MGEGKGAEGDHREELTGLRRANEALAASVKGLQARVDAQGAEAGAWEKRHREAVRTLEALQRSMVAASEKEQGLLLSNEAQAARVAELEARGAALARERDGAVAASARDRAAADEALALQALLARRLRGAVAALAPFVNPYDEKGAAVVAAGTEGDGAADAEGRYRLAVEAAEAEVAALQQGSTELEVALAAAQSERDALAERVERLGAEHARVQEEARRLKAGLAAAEAELGQRAAQLEGLEEALAAARGEAGRLRGELAASQAAVEEGRRARRELEEYAHAHRREVEQAAEERVARAQALAAMALEDVIAQQQRLGELQAAARQAEAEARGREAAEQTR